MKLLESNSEIISKILQEFARQLNPILGKAAVNATKKFKILVGQALRQQPEYSSLMTGELRLEFGIPDASSVESIIDKLSETVSITNTNVIVKGSSLNGGFKLTALEKSTANGTIDDSDANVSDSKGYSLPWLKWLLYEGNNTIVKNYEVKIGPNSNSRTGMAIMVKSVGDWRVPPSFAGTINNNWITRAIDSVANSVPKLLQQSLEESL